MTAPLRGLLRPFHRAILNAITTHVEERNPDAAAETDATEEVQA